MVIENCLCLSQHLAEVQCEQDHHLALLFNVIIAVGVKLLVCHFVLLLGTKKNSQSEGAVTHKEYS